jgi:glutamate 5-kinase
MSRVKKRIVLKLGSNTLTQETDHISRGKIEDIGRQILTLQNDYEFILVSSGAIAVARQFVALDGQSIDDTDVAAQQALAAIGQPQLMRVYHESFRDLGLRVSQCLLTHANFERQAPRQNIIDTINILCQHGYIPIINENDTVASDEIQFGDNDKLAALTAALIGADLCVIATNTNGICTRKSVEDGTFHTIESVSNIDNLRGEIANTKSTHGRGGMQSKIDAAKIAQVFKVNLVTDTCPRRHNAEVIKRALTPF